MNETFLFDFLKNYISLVRAILVWILLSLTLGTFDGGGRALDQVREGNTLQKILGYHGDSKNIKFYKNFTKHTEDTKLIELYQIRHEKNKQIFKGVDWI